MISGIAFDLDGTLLTDLKEIDCRTRDMICRAADLFNCPVVFASARMPSAIRLVVDRFGLQGGIVSYDGALCFPSHEELAIAVRDDPLTFSQPSEFSKALDDLGIFCGIYTKDSWVCNRNDGWMMRQIEVNGINPIGFGKNAFDDAVMFKGGFHKILLRGDRSSLEKLASQATEFVTEPVKAHFNGNSLVEITSGASDKYRGVTSVLRSLDVDLNGLMAFGDGENDVVMLKHARYSVAMANAVDQCKSAALYVCGSNNANGIADFLENFISENS